MVFVTDVKGHHRENNNNDNRINILKKKSLNGVNKIFPVETNLAARNPVITLEL